MESNHRTLQIALFVLQFLGYFAPSFAAESLPDVIDRVQPKIVKIYGAGGFRGMEAYQTGMLISPEGHILTVYSHVLDTDYLAAVLADGRRFQAKLLGADPGLEIAVLKIDGEGLPWFDLSRASQAEAGTLVLAFSNLFGVAVGDEPATVQRGTVSAVARLEARRGALETPYRGAVYVLDVTTNNPGAAGGALVARSGELLGMLGKELRNASNNTWLNFAIPIEVLRPSVEAIRAGKFAALREAASERRPERPLDLDSLGIALVPDVLERTPPYIDRVRPDSPADRAGLRPDDLIVLLGDRLVQSCKILRDDLEWIDREDAVRLTILRGQELVEFSLRAEPKKDPP